MKLLVTILALMLAAAASSAEDFAQRRATCAPVVTALYDDCSVFNFRRCAGGELYVEAFQPDLPGTSMLYGPDLELFYQRSLIGGPGINSVVDPRDQFSLTQLLSTGKETQDITVSSTMAGFPQNAQMRSVIAATGENYTVSGRDLQVYSSRFTLEIGFAGNEMGITGQGYLDVDLRVLFPGPSEYTFAGDALWVSPELIEIVGQGHPYFMSQIPEETCQDQLSLLTPDTALQVENSHDNI